MNAVGVWFYSIQTNRYLYLMRNDSRQPHTWGLPGGKMHINESLHDTITRECNEELGFMPEYRNLIPIEKFTSADDKFCYHTFFACVDQEFQPKLNDEHLGYAWISADTRPKPLHPGLWSTTNFDVVKEKINVILEQLQISA